MVKSILKSLVMLLLRLVSPAVIIDQTVNTSLIGYGKSVYLYEIKPGGFVRELYGKRIIMLNEFLMRSIQKPRNLEISFYRKGVKVYKRNQECFTAIQGKKAFDCNISKTIVFNMVEVTNKDKDTVTWIQYRTKMGNLFVKKYFKCNPPLLLYSRFFRNSSMFALRWKIICNTGFK